MARLTDEVQRNIVSFLRAGGFAHVAAEAAGVPREVFDDWLSRPAPRYRAFALAVRQAEAQARLRAEIGVLEAKPLDWLKSGPGKPKPGAPGWTAAARAPVVNDGGFALMNPEIQKVIGLVFGGLEPFAEARVAVAQTLDSFH